MHDPVPSLLALAVVGGPISHLTYWSRQELDALVLPIVFRAGLAHLSLVCFFAAQREWLDASKAACTLEFVYYISLTISIILYRLFFHPLRHFPGPFWAKWSMWWKVWAIAKRGAHFRVIDDLHQTYGDVVRVGPNHLSVNSVEALLALYGRQSPCTKPASYLIGGIRSLQSEREPHRHQMRRAVWDKALGSQASNVFLPKLESIANLMVEKLRSHNGRAVNVNDWMHYFTFDVMGEFALSHTYGQLQHGMLHEGVRCAAEYLKYAIYGVQLPWLAYLLTQIPFLPDPQALMMRSARKSLDERTVKRPDVPDALSHILVHNMDPNAQHFLSRHDIESDVFLIQIAGSDTSYSVLMDLFFWLAARPWYQDIIRAEVEPNLINTRTSTFLWSGISAEAFLDALIRETMRFHPPVSSGLGRLTPSNTGFTIPTDDLSKQSLHIPPEVVVSVPTYSLHRDPRYFVHPDSFIPERWLGSQDLILDKRAFCPFSIGSYGCAGKYFAYMEIKVLVAKIMVNFDVQFVDGQFDAAAQQAWLDGHQDHMTLQAPELKLKFLPRQQI